MQIHLYPPMVAALYMTPGKSRDGSLSRLDVAELHKVAFLLPLGPWLITLCRIQRCYFSCAAHACLPIAPGFLERLPNGPDIQRVQPCGPHHHG